MARRISMSKAKRLTESLKSKNRRFQESSLSVYDWFEKYVKSYKPSTMKRADAIEELSDFEGMQKALERTFSSSDKLVVALAVYKDTAKLSEQLGTTLALEGYKRITYSWDVEAFEDVFTGEYKTSVVLASNSNNEWAVVFKSN